MLKSTFLTLRNNEIQGGDEHSNHTWRKTNRTGDYTRNSLNWIKQLFSFVRSTFLNKRSGSSIEGRLTISWNHAGMSSFLFAVYSRQPTLVLAGGEHYMYMFRANCKFAQFRNCVAQFENIEIAYRFRNCPPILKLPPNFEIALRNFKTVHVYVCKVTFVEYGPVRSEAAF